MNCAGLVCTACHSNLWGYDARSRNEVVFAEELCSRVKDMLALETPEAHGSPQLLIGGSRWKLGLIGCLGSQYLFD